MARKHDSRIWCIRAGKNGTANDVFMKNDVIALEDVGMRDLSKLDLTREAFYTKYRTLHPDQTRTGSAGIAGKYYRFAIEVRVGDTVLYPCLIDSVVYVGLVTGGYKFEKTDDFPHQHSVKWKWGIQKKQFSIQAIYELNAARTFFEFKRNAEELKSRIASGDIIKVSKSNRPSKEQVTGLTGK